ncbi:MAG: hypothetical protein COB39_03630 [Marinosulfonomonas sp.]|nr:MAG: hypothetical protein COB39_03630 [Marinosulfonomonas sp.]
MRIILALLYLLPTGTLAQNFTTAIDADLTGDGLVDRAELRGSPIDMWGGNPPTECFPNN